MTTGLTDAAAAGVWIAAAVLLWAGVAKLHRPAGTATALALVHLPPSRGLARALGAVEIGVGAGALTLGGGWPVALVAAAYGGFALVSLRGRGRPQASCGCFGDRAAPLTGIHVMINFALGVVSLVAAAVGVPGVPEAAGPDPLLLAVATVLLATAAALVAASLTSVPVLLREMPRRTTPRVELATRSTRTREVPS